MSATLDRVGVAGSPVLYFAERTGKGARVPHPIGIKLTGPQGERRGFVDPKTRDGRPVLEDLWVMQGSICDLKCKHCYTASSPTNGTLEQIRFEELKLHLDDARA